MQLVVEPAREHIGYVDWVDRVFRAIGAHAAADRDAVYLGVQAANVASRLGIDPAAPGFFESPERLAIILAFADLRQVGVIVSPEPQEYERARLRACLENGGCLGQATCGASVTVYPRPSRRRVSRRLRRSASRRSK